MSAKRRARKRRARERDRLGLPTPPPTPPQPKVTPIAGPRFRRAAGLPVEGSKCRKVLCLLAAYADAGEASPSLRDISARADLKPHIAHGVLKKLVRQGWLRVDWAPAGERRRNRYALQLHARAATHRTEAPKRKSLV